MKNLYNEYKKEYDFIYQANNAGMEVAGQTQATAFFIDVIMTQYLDLLSDFNGYINDVIMSDREAAAFVFACENLDLL